MTIDRVRDVRGAGDGKIRPGERRVPPCEITWPKGTAPLKGMADVSTERSQVQIEPATRPLRLLYLLSIVGLFLPATGSGWVALATGGSWAALFGVSSLLLFALALYRAFSVLRRASMLDAPVMPGLIRWMRTLAVGLMLIGVLSLVLNLSSGHITRWLFPRPSGNGIEFFVVGIWIALAGGWGPVGVLLFECSRLLGFERARNEEKDRCVDDGRSIRTSNGGEHQ